MWVIMRDNMRANRAGNLAEKAVKTVFGISEPAVEVKASIRSYYRVKIPLRQLEEQWEKDYIIVVYDCVRKKITKGKKKGLFKHDLMVEKAFKNKLEFIVIAGFELMKLIAENQLNVRYLQRDYHRPPKLIVECPIRFLKVGEPVELDSGHLRYGYAPSICGEYIHDDEPPF